MFFIKFFITFIKKFYNIINVEKKIYKFYKVQITIVKVLPLVDVLFWGQKPTFLHFYKVIKKICNRCNEVL